MIIKTKFFCKAGSKIGSGRGSGMSGPGSHPSYSYKASDIVPTTWIDRFIEGKWYEGEYETWNWEDGYRINGGWRRYWVVNELGKKEEISRAVMNAIFEYKTAELRDVKIDDILNGL